MKENMEIFNVSPAEHHLSVFLFFIDIYFVVVVGEEMRHQSC